MPVETVEGHIEILVDESGKFRVNGEELIDRSMRTLQAAIYKISSGDTTMPMIISADAQAAHQDVVQAMDAAVRKDLRVLWQTQGYTPHAFAAHPRVPAAAVAALAEAMLEDADEDAINPDKHNTQSAL